MPVTEWRLFEEGTTPEFTTPGWYRPRDAAPHIDQAGHSERLRVTADVTAALISQQPIRDLADVGCGDGGFMTLLGNRGVSIPMRGADLAAANVTAARLRGHDASLADWVTSPPTGDLVTCLEVLEHLTDPHGYARELAGRFSWLVASSPFNETPDSHYPYHAWAWDLDGYKDMLTAAGWQLVSQRTSWICQIVVARSGETA